jgi:phenylacetate-coenzyme A ligase PaaK-like adenylate-forming protein
MTYGSSLTRRLYYSLPSAGKNLLASAYGWKQRQLRYGSIYQQHLSFLRESQYWPPDQLVAYQQELLRNFLTDVVPRTPFYRSRSIYLDLLSRGAPLDEFPLLTKTDLRRQLSDFYHEDLEAMSCRWSHTSGTTGSAISFPVTTAHIQRDQAFRALAYEWGGVSLDGRDRIAFCAGHPVTSHRQQKPPFWTYDLANNALYFSSYHLKKSNLRAYVQELERFQPIALAGYPSSIYLLALAYENFGSSLPLKAIFTSSETLLDWQRARIETAFGAKVFNYYGSAENCAHATECERGELHLKPEYSAVMVLNYETHHPCGPGETGFLVGTGFDNPAFPLVQYNPGDVVTIQTNQDAKCGRSGPLLEAIVGRVEDYIFTPDGRFVGRLDHLFKQATNIIEAQLYQDTLNEVVCRIVKGEGYSATDEAAIIREARERLGFELKIRFEYLEQIPRLANGKFPFVISRLNQSEMLDELTSLT